MRGINFKKVEDKYELLLNVAKNYMHHTGDAKHGYGHVIDTYNFAKKILNKNAHNADIDCVVISVFWHDVGRVVCADGHEKVSANMLKEQMHHLGMKKDLINKCILAVKNHKWSSVPTTIEGIIVRDADKLAFLGLNRWKECLDAGEDMKDILALLPKLKDGILQLEESKVLYTKAIKELKTFLKNYKRPN